MKARIKLVKKPTNKKKSKCVKCKKDKKVNYAKYCDGCFKKLSSDLIGRGDKKG